MPALIASVYRQYETSEAEAPYMSRTASHALSDTNQGYAFDYKRRLKSHVHLAIREIFRVSF